MYERGRRGGRAPDAALPYIDADLTSDASSGVTHHYLCVVNAGPVITVYDIDRNGIPEVEQIIAGSSTEDPRGVVAFTDGMLYVSYGCGNPTGCSPWLTKYDLLAKTPVWTKTVPLGIDSHSISADERREGHAPIPNIDLRVDLRRVERRDIGHERSRRRVDDVAAVSDEHIPSVARVRDPRPVGYARP